MQARQKPLTSVERDTIGSAIPADELHTPLSTREVRPLVDGSEVQPVDSPARLLQQQIASRIQRAAPQPADTRASPNGLPVIARAAIILSLSLALWVLPIAIIVYFAK